MHNAVASVAVRRPHMPLALSIYARVFTGVRLCVYTHALGAISLTITGAHPSPDGRGIPARKGVRREGTYCRDARYHAELDLAVWHVTEGSEIGRLCDDIMKFQTYRLLALFGNIEDDVSAKFHFHITMYEIRKIKSRDWKIKRV